jgi:hypothetical protein
MKKRVDETEYLLRSKENAKRLLKALKYSQRGLGKPQTVRELREEFQPEESLNEISLVS